MKRLFAVMMTLLLLVGAISVLSTPVAAEEKETIVIAGSDFQVSNNNTNNVKKVLNTLSIHGINKVDAAFFCGDYTLDAMESNQSMYGIQKLKDTFAPMTDTMIFVQGNHDIETTVGLSAAGAHDAKDRSYGAFVIREDQYREWGNNRQDTINMVKELRTYLEMKRQQKWNKPIFILCHIPLHWSNRTMKDGSGTDADVIFDALNEYGEKGMNIFFLYGHNHSGGYDDFMGGGAVYLKKGDAIEVCHGNKWEHKTRTLNFTYMNAGFIGYYSTTEKTTDAAITMSVFRIRGNEVIVTRYDGDFNLAAGRYGIHNLKSKGVWHPDHSKEGYHAVPNTLEYASSRKVTATDDVPVDTPMPSMTTTSYVPPYITTTSTATKAGGIVVNKTTGTTGTENAATSTATEDASAVTTTDGASEMTTTDKQTTTKTKAESNASQANPLVPWWAWLGMGIVALLLIGAVIAIILLARPIQPK